MRNRVAAQWFVLCLSLAVIGEPVSAEIITLKNGLTIEGSVGKLGSLDGAALSGASGGRSGH